MYLLAKASEKKINIEKATNQKDGIIFTTAPPENNLNT